MAAEDSGNDAARSGFTAQQMQNHHSSLLAKTLEYRLLADLTAHLMMSATIYDVLRGDVDHMGHDIVVEANGVLRHIQLKIRVRGGKADGVNVSLKLARKPSGCIIITLYDPKTLAIGPFGWFGGSPGEPLPPLGGKIARHSKANSLGVKVARPDHRILPTNQFEVVPNIAALAFELFGDGVDEGNEALLSAHLRERTGEYAPTVIQATCPDRLRWDNSADLALVINGYRLADRAGLGDPFKLYEPRRAQAQKTGTWPGDLLELWVTLHVEHRRCRMSSPFGFAENECRLLDRLCEQLQDALRRASYLNC